MTCYGCQLNDVPTGLSLNTTVLNLGNNSIVRIDDHSFKDLPHLRSLLLSRNQIHTISSGAFASLKNLDLLDLSNNNLEHFAFDSSVFKHLEKLSCLYLNNNNFHLKRLYPENAISHAKALTSLNIDIFEDFKFGQGFLNLTNLQTLNVFQKGTARISIRNTSFRGLEQSQITHFILYCTMKSMEPGSLSPLRNLLSLTLDSRKTLSIHMVLRALYGLQGRTMESIRLPHNHIRYTRNGYLEKTDLVFLGTICVRRLDLAGNLISGITMEAVLSWHSRACLEVLDVSRNVLESPQLLSLLVLFPSITHVYASYEVRQYSRKRRSIWNRKSIVFFPQSLRHLYLSHDPMNFDISDVTTVSDDNNLRTLDVSYPVMEVTCSGGYIKGLLRLQQLIMSGWECSHTSNRFFVEFPNLSRLDAKNCNLGNKLGMEGHSLFTGLYNLSFTDLAFNNINTLSLDTFKDQAYSLKVLNLTGNHMERIPMDILTLLYVLEILDLRDNVIIKLSGKDCSFLENHRSRSDKFQILLAGNPVACNCDNLEFVTWLGTSTVVYDRVDISCITPHGSKVLVSEFLETMDEFQDSCVAQFWLLMSVILTVVCILMGILSRLAWRHSITLRVMCRDPREHGVYPYDLFLVYSEQDSGWVRNTLAPWLEEHGIEYCAEDKNLELGGDKADQIMNAIDDSCQVVFIVSCTFLECDWSLYTMKFANTYSYRDGRENMSIIIMLNDMKRSEFPKRIRKNWDAIRPVKWPNEGNTNRSQVSKEEEIFWKRLLSRIRRGSNRLIPVPVSDTAV